MASSSYTSPSSSSIIIVLLSLAYLVNSAVVSGRNSVPILCRPDQIYESDSQKCLHLKQSISSLVKDILDTSDLSVPFLHYTPEALASNKVLNTSIIPSVVHVSDLFIQNLAFINEANMTNCIAMAACNEHCYSWPERTTEQKQQEKTIVDKFLEQHSQDSSSKKSEDEDDTPDFVRVIMQASKKGIELARKGNTDPKNGRMMNCFTCQTDYQNGCPPMNYAYTVRINALYRHLVELNVSFVNLAPKLPQNLSPEILYYHYSMHFVDRANLTTCYALVSCENTCRLYHATITELGINVIEPPASESPLMKGDPNKSKSIDLIHHAAVVGYNFAADNQCEQCRHEYPGCSDDKYEIAKASAAIFGN